jgi:hypothetical protein
MQQFIASCQEEQVNGVVLRKPTSWYFENDSFLTKQVFNNLLTIIITFYNRYNKRL